MSLLTLLNEIQEKSHFAVMANTCTVCNVVPSISRLRPVRQMQPEHHVMRPFCEAFPFCANRPECKPYKFCHSSGLVLQFLKDISKHTSLRQVAVAPVLAISLKQDLEARDHGMSAVTSDLLSMVTQTSPQAWMQQLTAEVASTMAILFTRDQRWSEAAAIYETRVRASQVISRLPPCDR